MIILKENSYPHLDFLIMDLDPYYFIIDFAKFQKIILYFCPKNLLPVVPITDPRTGSKRNIFVSGTAYKARKFLH
jgi:hypothetical protein